MNDHDAAILTARTTRLAEATAPLYDRVRLARLLCGEDEFKLIPAAARAASGIAQQLNDEPCETERAHYLASRIAGLASEAATRCTPAHRPHPVLRQSGGIR